MKALFKPWASHFDVILLSILAVNTVEIGRDNFWAGALFFLVGAVASGLVSVILQNVFCPDEKKGQP